MKALLVLLRDCRDMATTRHSLHSFLDWLHDKREFPTLAARAARRARSSTLSSAKPTSDAKD